tara:strand:+ start:474 stop:1214 length:741 start_codon:yes stop_codon:yes gene_type:complete
MNIFLHTKTNEIYSALKKLKHNVTTSYNFDYWQKFDNLRYQLIYIEEDGRFNLSTLISEKFQDAIIFYKCHDSKKGDNESFFLREADKVFTSNIERCQNEKKLEWLNWYAEEQLAKKENDIYEAENVDSADLSEIKRSKFFIINSEPKSISKAFFESFSSKTLVLCKRPKNLDFFKTVFEENEHIIYFDSEEDKDKKLKIYSNSEEDFTDITSRALYKLNKFHSPKERSKEIIKKYKKRSREVLEL